MRFAGMEFSILRIAFRSLAEIPATFFRVPIAIVSLVDKDRIWFESPYGMENGKLDRANWLCASAISVGGDLPPARRGSRGGRLGLSEQGRLE